MNKDDFDLIADLLEYANNEFCNHTCNDYPLQDNSFTRQLAIDYEMWNSCGQEETTASYGGEIYFMDYALMSYYADKCKEYEPAIAMSELQAEIARLRTELSALREAQRWIPVTERLPKVDGFVSDRVEVCVRGYRGKIEVGDMNCSYIPKDWHVDGWVYRAGWYPPNTGTPTSYEITHWRPLPEPPTEK